MSNAYLSKKKKNKIENNDYDIEMLMMEDKTYPSPSNNYFQSSIYVKRDYYIHSIPFREKLDSYSKIKEYRDDKCGSGFKLNEHQSLLANFINPHTPYRGVLIYHGTGTGKTCAAVAIAEKFKTMVEKYNVKIHVLVPGPLNKQNFISEIIKCTGETYFNTIPDKTVILKENEDVKMKKQAHILINQYYRIMSHKSFYKKVLGEKIFDKDSNSLNKVKKTYRKTTSGDYERDISIDRIYSLDNTLLIIDEAHNLTKNEYGSAVTKIIESSKNLKIILLSATPMKNLADDIVPLLNLLRPADSKIERDKIFTTSRNYLMDFKEGGREYLRNMSRGYVSYLRGADPLTFAERIDVGEIPPGLSFTKVTRCYMLEFQKTAYLEVVLEKGDSLDKRSEAVANFVFPGLNKNKKDIKGYYGIDGINEIKSQLKNNSTVINNLIASTVLKNYAIKDTSSLVYLTDNNKVISGDIFKEIYLKYFSIKFYTALQKINNQVVDREGTGLIFIFSNLVKVGVDLFNEVLQKNGYLEFNENPNNYTIKNDTKCYYCSKTFDKHGTDDKIKLHTFYPATYIAITGKSEENADQIPEEKHRILKNIFNNTDNRDGRKIKLVLGSKVMNEGITLKNIKEILILDVHYNLGRTDQVIGRGIRFCTHYNITNEENPFPKVNINKYVISDKESLTTEEELYKKAEYKYRLIKETERILQEEAVDCPLNRNGNIFQEELEKYANCGTPDKPCPAICGYMTCDFKCGDKKLNSKYYDPNRSIYRKLNKDELDYSTYNNTLASEEINYAKLKIKDMFRLEHVYTIDEILKYVKDSYSPEKKDMFDDYYVFRALDDMIPITNNDFNNFKDTIFDKFNNSGYLIYRKIYYIFQPFNENEDLPMYYRNTFNVNSNIKLNLKDFIQNTNYYSNYKKTHSTDPQTHVETLNRKRYDFVSIQEYYDSREEFEYVGTLDQKSTRKELNSDDAMNDEFKIRGSRPKILEKKRETGVPSFKGAVCNTSKDKEFLLKIAKKLNINIDGAIVRDSICDLIKNKLIDLEKYSTSRDKNKVTYMIIPFNHTTLPFPLNLEDRVKNIINEIKKATRSSIDCKINTIKKSGKYADVKYVSYQLIFEKVNENFIEILRKYKAFKDKNVWVINVE